MQKLRIGITMRGSRVGGELRDSLARDWWTYTQTVRPQAHLLPLPNLGPGVANLAQDLELNGLILTGGDDLGAYPERDASEWALLDWARAKKNPVLGVCRGMQVLCVHGGGEIKACPTLGHRNTQHEVHWICPLEGAVTAGSVWTVNSYHNFRVERVPDNYRVLARSLDQTAEAVLHQELPWLGIQWHPEREHCDQVLQGALLSRFLDWCQGG